MIQVPLQDQEAEGLTDKSLAVNTLVSLLLDFMYFHSGIQPPDQSSQISPSASLQEHWILPVLSSVCISVWCVRGCMWVHVCVSEHVGSKHMRCLYILLVSVCVRGFHFDHQEHMGSFAFCVFW